MATIGKPKLKHQVIVDAFEARVTIKSGKPEEIYQMAERMMPDATKIEVFGRKGNLRSGWTTIENEFTDIPHATRIDDMNQALEALGGQCEVKSQKRTLHEHKNDLAARMAANSNASATADN